MLNPQLRLGRGVLTPLSARVIHRPATLADAIDLAPRLRDADKQEVLAASGIPAEYALRLNVKDADVVCVDGRPEIIYGCGASIDDPNTGVPWMLSSPVPFTPEWRREFLRESARYVAQWQAQFPLLHNFMDARNTVHRRWLEWLGFKFIARHETYGPLGLPFYEFVRIAQPSE